MSARPRRDERGVVLPTRLMVFSISAVALAGLLFVATHGEDDGGAATTASSRPTQTAAADPTAVPDPLVEPSERPTPKAPVVRKGMTYVVVFNNSNIKGLAGKTATRAQGAGWNVVGSDNWYGTVDTSTVYFGPRMRAAADLLAKDLGITSVKPAVDPMRADRLTVILTADYASR